MELKISTPKGTLFSRYKLDRAEHPGFDIDLFKKNKPKMPVCTVEYEPDKDCVQVIVYGDGNSEEPTHIIPVTLADYMTGEKADEN